ncbi:MAG: hypothetical protein LUF02_03525 [Erysipelotrichaceae bacterium]|nr:hypothetical protein [Erysipelotrichaceae bacterium]
MLVVLKENLKSVDFERLLYIVRKYDIEAIHSNCFELPNDVSLVDLNTLQEDKAVDKIVVDDCIFVENIVKTYGFINK